MIKIFENDDFVVDYDKENKRYRVSYFEDHHFKEECWFDEYEEENITLQQVLNEMEPPTLLEDLSPEEIDRIVNEFNSIGCTSFQLTYEETRNLLEKTKLEATIDDWKRLGYTDEEAEKLVEASKIYQ